MIKSFLSWGTALLVLCSGLLSSCDDKNEGGGNPDPTVTIAIGDAAFNALKFTLTLKDADKCSYICAKASETVPTAEQILANGKSVTASGVIEVGNLEPNTAYRLSAVAQKGNISGKVYSIEHTTSAPGVHPAVEGFRFSIRISPVAAMALPSRRISSAVGRVSPSVFSRQT